ncbi:bacteriophage lambda head decoration protein D [Azospirillum brasilense]|uniref:Bacteriophage lambda head decoration protein D n=1 Tax=Azospirillum brasilense TaxID=192 RepID=A0A560BSZ6_AZOBR|nr:head decoration protein [Azospirillum brasilense]TWA75639.1 bacteriophage lambda head decoration protein D [Azospirillum brasilense]
MSLSISTIGDNASTPGVRAETYVPDQLIAGRFPLVTDTVTLAAGQNLPRGAVLGVITATGKFKLSAAASTDGSQTPTAILVDGVNATNGDTLAGVYLTGEFNQRAVTFGAGHSVSSTKEALRLREIFLKSSVSADDPS